MNVDDRLELFVRRVREERLQLGLSIANLAPEVATARLGQPGHMSVAMLGAIERGNRRPSLAQAFAIADALEVPLGELVGEAPHRERRCVACTTDAAHARRHRELLAATA